MPTTLPPADPDLSSAFAQASSDPARALEVLKPARDRGERLAIHASGYIAATWGVPNPPERDRLIRAAVESDAWYLRQRYIDGFGGRPDEMPERAPEMAELLRVGPAPPDPLGIVGQCISAQRGELAAQFFQLVDAMPPWPDASIEEIRGRIAGLSELMDAASEEVRLGAEGAEELIAKAVEEVNRGKSEFTVDTDEARALTQALAASGLASEYESNAKKDGKNAAWFSGAALFVGAVAAYVAIKYGGEYIDKEDHPSPTTIFARTGLALPFIAVAAYLGSLANSYRRMSWHWRHIALQLRAFTPFIQRLERTDQQLLTALMTPRFFPGQSLDPHNRGSEAKDDSALYGELNSRFGASSADPFDALDDS